MKTVLFINSTGAHYFRRAEGGWQQVESPDARERLWVIANLPEESLEICTFPFLIGRDRSNFLERRLNNSFPHSKYRSATVIAGGLTGSGTAVLAGLATADLVINQIEHLDMSISGVWGAAMLLTLMARQHGLSNAVLALPSAHHLRILALKDGLPALTRCVRRYSEDTDNGHHSDISELLRTRQHLENQRVFEHEKFPPVLYLGDAAALGEQFAAAGLTLLPLPDAFLPKGEAGNLHALFEFVVKSPRGQIAPLPVRARHLAETLRELSYFGIGVSLLAIILFGQSDFRKLIDLHQRNRTLLADLQLATGERNHLADNIVATGKNPELVRQATRFAALEMDSAPSAESIFQLAAAAIADLPQARIKTLSFRLPKANERFCRAQSAIELPLISGSKPDNAGAEGASGLPVRHAELQFTVLLPNDLSPAAQAELRKHISSTLNTQKGVQLMDDPAAFSLINTLKGGLGLEKQESENIWCMSVQWQQPDDATALIARERP